MSKADPKTQPFLAELEELINKHSIESESDTPDFILARYLRGCLDTFELTIHARDVWYKGVEKQREA